MIEQIHNNLLSASSAAVPAVENAAPVRSLFVLLLASLVSIVALSVVVTGVANVLSISITELVPVLSVLISGIINLVLIIS